MTVNSVEILRRDPSNATETQLRGRQKHQLGISFGLARVGSMAFNEQPEYYCQFIGLEMTSFCTEKTVLEEDRWHAKQLEVVEPKSINGCAETHLELNRTLGRSNGNPNQIVHSKIEHGPWS